MGPSHREQLFDTTGKPAQARFPETAGRHIRPSDMDPNQQGVMFDPAGPWTRARVTRENWSTPRALVHCPESPGTAGGHGVPNGTGPILPGLLIDPMRIRTQARVSGTSGQTRGPAEPVTNRIGQLVDIAGSLTQARIVQDNWSTPPALGPVRE